MKTKWLRIFLALMALPVLALGASLAAGEQALDCQDEDLNSAYDLTQAVRLDLGQQQNAYQITQGGTYILSGSLKGGLSIRAGEEDLVRLVLNNVSIENPNGPAICGLQADKVILTLAEGSVNNISDGEGYTLDEEGADAAIYMKSDLTINGSGSLRVKGQTAHGILSKDGLLIISGSLDITSVKDGLSGKDSVGILDGTIRIQSGSDGIVSSSAQTDKGSVRIEGGSITIIAQRDGIQAQGGLTLTGGSFDIRTGEGGTQVQLTAQAQTPAQGQETPDADTLSSATRQPGTLTQRGTPPEGMHGQDGWFEEIQTDDSVESTKGIKGALWVNIQGGLFSLNTADDAIHSKGDVTIDGGEFTILTGDDGMHADGSLHIKSGSITITGCYEGLEGKTVTIDSGDITMTASDDGINAASGSVQAEMGMRGDMSAQEDVWVIINGGTVKVSAGYDGIDSNGSIAINGGEVDLTIQRAGGGNMAIDPNGAYTYTAGQVTTNDGSQNGRSAMNGPMAGTPQDGQPMRPNRRP